MDPYYGARIRRIAREYAVLVCRKRARIDAANKEAFMRGLLDVFEGLNSCFTSSGEGLVSRNCVDTLLRPGHQLLGDRRVEHENLPALVWARLMELIEKKMAASFTLQSPN